MRTADVAVPRAGEGETARADPEAGQVPEDSPYGPPTAWRLFLLFASISSVTIGGGYAIVPVIGRAFEKRMWIGEDEFQDIFAAAQAFPGPIALSTSILSSRRLIGSRGLLPAIAGVVLPPFVALVLVGSLLGKYGKIEAIGRFLHGAGATVPGLVAALLFRTAKKRRWNLPRAGATIALAVALALLPRMSLPILLASLVILYFAERSWKS